MNQNLLSRVLEFLRRKMWNKRWQRAVTCLAAVAVFGVTYALVLPAITMTNMHPTLEAEQTVAMSGDELTVKVTAEADKFKEEIFVLKAEGEGADLSHVYIFDEEGIAVIEDEEGKEIELHREIREDEKNTVYYWFSLEAGEKTEFMLMLEDSFDDERHAKNVEKPVRSVGNDENSVNETATSSNAATTVESEKREATASNAVKATLADASANVQTVTETSDDGSFVEILDGAVINDLPGDEEVLAPEEDERIEVVATLELRAGSGEDVEEAVKDAEKNAEKRGDALVKLTWEIEIADPPEMLWIGDGARIALYYDDENAIPYDAVLNAEIIEEDDSSFEEYLTRTEEVFKASASNAGRKAGAARFFDVKLQNAAGEEIQPAAPVRVWIGLDNAFVLDEEGWLGTAVLKEDKVKALDPEDVEGDEEITSMTFRTKELAVFAAVSLDPDPEYVEKTFLEPHPCSVPVAQLSSMDFSSGRLLVKAADPSVFTKDTKVIGNWQDVYLLQFDSEEEARNAFTYYVDKLEAVSPDEDLLTAEGNGEDGDGVSDTVSIPNNYEYNGESQAYTEGENPISQLESISEGEGGSDAASSNIPVIALIDTGVNHSGVEAYSVIGSDTEDDNGHGTKMYRIIKEANPDAKVISIKALDENGRGQVSSIYAAIALAVEKNVDIINLSITTKNSIFAAMLEEVVQSALDKNIVVVAAAGNHGKNAAAYTPGNIEGVTTIGACDHSGTLLAASNWGEVVDYLTEGESTSEAAARFTGLISNSATLPDYMDIVQPYLDNYTVIFLQDPGEWPGEDKEYPDETPELYFETADGNNVDVTVKKVWKDAATVNHDNDTVTVQLCKNGTPMTGKTAELKKSNNWTYTFTGNDQPKFDGDNIAIQYTVVETSVRDGYAPIYASVAPQAGSGTISYDSKLGGRLLVGGTSGRANDSFGSFMDQAPMETITVSVGRMSITNSENARLARFEISQDGTNWTTVKEAGVEWTSQEQGYWKRGESTDVTDNRGWICYTGPIPATMVKNTEGEANEHAHNVPDGPYVYNGETVGQISNGLFKPLYPFLRLTFKDAATMEDGALADVVMTYSNIRIRNATWYNSGSTHTNYRAKDIPAAADVTKTKTVSSVTNDTVYSYDTEYDGFGMFDGRYLAVRPNLQYKVKNNNNVYNYNCLGQMCDVNVKIMKNGNPVSVDDTFLFSVLDLDVQDGVYGQTKISDVNINNKGTGSFDNGRVTVSDFRESTHNIQGTKSAAYVPKTPYTHSEHRPVTLTEPGQVNTFGGDGGTTVRVQSMKTIARVTDVGSQANGLSFLGIQGDSSEPADGSGEMNATGTYDSGFAVLCDARNGITFTWTGQGYNMGTTLFTNTIRNSRKAWEVRNYPDRKLILKKGLDEGSVDPGNTEFVFHLQFFAAKEEDESGTVISWETTPIQGAGKIGDLTYIGDGWYEQKLKAGEQKQISLPAYIKYGITEVTSDRYTTSYAIYDTDTSALRISGDTGSFSDWILDTNQTVEFTNTVKPVEVILVKKNAGETSLLPGAKFSLYTKYTETEKILAKDSSGNEIKDVVTGTDGKVCISGSGLKLGTYYLVETVAPTGYLRIPDPIVLKVGMENVKYTQTDRAGGQEQTVTYTSGAAGTFTCEIIATDSAGVELPHTGGPGTLTYTLGGMMLLIASALLYGFRRRHEERRSA